jgi:hypothetical protein
MGLSVNLSTELIERARIVAKAQHRSVAKQIEYWAELGQACLDNPDLPVGFVQDLLEILADDSKKDYHEYKFEEFETNENTLYKSLQENSKKTAFKPKT